MKRLSCDTECTFFHFQMLVLNRVVSVIFSCSYQVESNKEHQPKKDLKRNHTNLNRDFILPWFEPSECTKTNKN